MTDNNKRPLLLRETAEIALNEVKRFVEPRLTADFNLRRVTAPLYLPAESGLAGPGPHVTFSLPGSGDVMAIVTDLDRWLRTQLVRYDSAPGFGVFTVMNALRPNVAETGISSPHAAAWAWQQVLRDDAGDDHQVLRDAATSAYRLMRDAEKMILDMFPHLTQTLPEELDTVRETDIPASHPAAEAGRTRHLYMRERTDRALFVIDDAPLHAADNEPLTGYLMVWNRMLQCPLTLATFGVYPPGRDADIDSVGGNLNRDILAFHILHQTELLK